MIDDSISDSRQQEKPLPFQKFNFDSVTARFVKFEALSWYGAGGGLQYFNMKKTGKQGKIKKKVKTLDKTLHSPPEPFASDLARHIGSVGEIS